MSQPRSQKLISWHSAAGATVSPVWTSPAGYVTLVKRLLVRNAAGAALDVNVVVADTVSGASIWFAHGAIPAGDTIDTEVWIVLHPGDLVYATVTADGAHIWVSGALLTGEPQVPPATREVPGQAPAPGPRGRPPLTEPGPTPSR